MRRKELIFLTTLVLVLSAGVVLGRLSVRMPAEAPKATPAVQATTRSSDDWFNRELGATPAQSEKIDAIWSDTYQKARQLNHARGQLERNREQAVYDLLTWSQAMEYGRVIDDYHDQQRELDAQRDQLIKSASERTRGILTEEQQKKFDQLMKEEGPRARGGPPGSSRGGPPGSSGRRPATREQRGP